jgi:hypothetical protein
MYKLHIDLLELQFPMALFRIQTYEIRYIMK